MSFKLSSPSSLIINDQTLNWKSVISIVTWDGVGVNLQQRKALSNLVGVRGRSCPCGHEVAGD